MFLRYLIAPTLDSLRFQSPKRPHHMRDDGILIADTFPPMCFQSGIGVQPTFRTVQDYRSNEVIKSDQSEDCLFLK